MLALFLFSIQNKPGRWHKVTVASMQLQLLKGAHFHGGSIYFGGVCDGFCGRVFGGVSDRFFPWILLEIASGVFLENLPKPCKQRTCEIFSKKNPRNSRPDSTCLWVHCCSLGARVRPGNCTAQTLQIHGVAGTHATMPMLRGMLVC